MDIFFTNRDELTKVSLQDVMYIKVDGNYSLIGMKSGRTLSLLSSLNEIKKLLDEISPGNFVVVGRSHMVNKQYVSQIQSTRKIIVVADDNTREQVTLHVSKEGIAQLMEAMKKEKGRVLNVFLPKNGNTRASVASNS